MKKKNDERGFDVLLDDLNDDELIHLPLTALEPDPEQDRKDFTSDGAVAYLNELASSMSNLVNGVPYGVRQPIEVTEVGVGSYRIIGGENRWRAAGLANIETVPCIIRREISAELASLDMLVSNLLRRNLGVWELALALKKRMDTHKLQSKELAIKLGKSQAWVTKYTSILKLDFEVQELAKDGLVKNVALLQDIDKLPPETRVDLILHVRDGGDVKTLVAKALATTARPKKPKEKGLSDKYSVSLPQDKALKLLQKMGYKGDIVKNKDFGDIVLKLLEQ